ncbi:MAG TPA: hypothetical protein VN843_07240 [Anaerolineales bacterium]|nr:hypothetical protein [Anaerolineales bacterium]
MPIFQSLVNNDELFKGLKNPCIIINDLPNTTAQDREAINRLITTTYSTDMVTILPSCAKGCTKGEFSKKTICEYCHTPVVSAIENTIEPLVWFRQPHGVEKLLSPIVWLMLEDRFSRGKFSYIRWLTDTSYVSRAPRPVLIDEMIDDGIERGYNYFIRNFFAIIQYLLKTKEFRAKRGSVDYLEIFLEKNKDILFSSHIPLLNRSLLIIEKTLFATYIDDSVPIAMDAIETMVSIDRDFYDQSGPVKENRTARAMYRLSCEFFDNYLKRNVSKKTGLLRHHVGGSRLDFSARAVISSITDRHRYDEIEVPWGIGLAVFRPMLMNKLINKSGMMVNDAIGLLLSHSGVYHPLIDHYLKEIISETRGNRYPVIFNRFPCLLQGSIQRVYIPRVKTDPKDPTLGISILIVTALNADNIFQRIPIMKAKEVIC